MIRLRKKDEFLGAIASPARGDGDAILLVDGVTEFAGEESSVCERRFNMRKVESTIFSHFAPLLTTSRATGQHFYLIFYAPSFFATLDIMFSIFHSAVDVRPLSSELCRDAIRSASTRQLRFRANRSN